MCVFLSDFVKTLFLISVIHLHKYSQLRNKCRGLFEKLNT